MIKTKNAIVKNINPGVNNFLLIFFLSFIIAYIPKTILIVQINHIPYFNNSNIPNMYNTKIIVFSEVSLILTIASVVLSIVFFTYLSKLFKNISQKTPFTIDNINYLVMITYILIANIVVDILLEFIVKTFVNVDVSNNYGFNSIIVMMVLACLTHIFRYGYNLQKNTNSDIY